MRSSFDTGPPPPLAAAPAEDSPRARLVAALAALGALLVMAAPVARAPQSLALGVPEGEGMAHLWGLVTAAEGLWRSGPYVRDSLLVAWPTGVHLDLVDPIHLLFVAPGVQLAGLRGGTVGWNLLHLAHLALLALGAWRLARRLEPGRPWAAALATIGAVATPYVWGGLPLGRSELLGLMLLPLLLAEALAAVQSGGAWRHRVAAVALLAAIAGSGWQPLMQATLLGLPTALVLLRHLGLPRAITRREALVIVLPAALLTLPQLVAHLRTGPWWMERAGGMDVLGPGAPSIDLPATLRLSELQPSMEMTIAPYPGLLAVLLLLLAAWRGPRPLALLGLGLLVLTIGPKFNLGNPDDRFLGPAWLLARILPPLGGLNDWGRLSLGVGPLVAAIGALGLSRELHGGRGALLTLGLGALWLLDGMSYRIQAPPSFETTPPAGLLERYLQLPEGPVLELPGVAPSEATAISDNDRSMLWSLSHRRPVPMAPSPWGAPMLTRSIVVRLHNPEVPARPDPCLLTERHRLYDLGFRSVLLHHSRVKAMDMDALLTRLIPALGDPVLRDPAVTIWRLYPGPTGPGHCAPPPLPRTGPDAGQNNVGPPPPSRQAPPLVD